MILRSVLNCALSFCAIAAKILLLVKRLPKKLAQLGVNRFRIIVTQKAEARVDLFLEQNAVGFGETRQHLDQQAAAGSVLPKRCAACARRAASRRRPAPSQTIGKRRDLLHRAIDFIRDCCNQFGHEISEVTTVTS